MKVFSRGASWNVYFVVLFGFALIFLLFTGYVIPEFERYLIGSKKEMIRELTATVHELVQNYYHRFQTGELTEQEAKDRALKRMEALHYGPEGKDYFWVNDTNCVMLMHPYRHDLVGQDVRNYLDAKQKPLFQEFVKVASGGTHEGYVDYLWQWKDDANQIVPKVSHVRLFQPWGWIIGTGIYMDDVGKAVHHIERRLNGTAGILFAVLSLLSFVLIRTARKAMKEREKESQKAKVLSAIVESTTDFVSIATPQRNVTYINQAAARMLGRENVLPPYAMTIDSIHPPQTADLIIHSAIPAAIRDGVWSGDTAVNAKDGRVIPVSQVIIAHKNDAGDLEYISTIIRDISASSKLEEDLRKARDELERRVEERTTVLLRTNRQLEIENNERKTAERLLRYRADFEKLIAELSARFIECPPEQMNERINASLAEAGWFLRADRCFLAMYDEANCGVARIDGWARDGLDAVVKLYAQFSDAGRDWFYRQLQEGFPVHFRRGAELTDVDTDVIDVLTENGVECMLCFPVMAAGNVYGFWGVQALSPAIVWQKDLHQLFRVMSEVFSYALQRQKNEEEKQRLEIQLRQAQKMESIGQLAAGIAHEINTPAQYVGDNVRFLRKSFEELLPLLRSCYEGLPRMETVSQQNGEIQRLKDAFGAADWDFIVEEIPGALRQTEDGVVHITRIVRAMKEFSHSGFIEMQPSDINRIVDNTVIVTRNEWSTVADLELHLDPSLAPVLCRPDEIGQVLLNVLVNACHAVADGNLKNSRGKGLIQIETRSSTVFVQISIRDNGVGIPTAIRDRIYDPFFTTKDVGRGSGQGLYISYDIVVNKHGGELFFESEEGVGTTFYIRLPKEGPPA